MLGAKSTLPGAGSPAILPRFDWYAATLPATDPISALGELATALCSEAKPLGRGLYGYSETYELVADSGVVARCLAGGSNPGVHAWASGEDTEGFVSVVRTRWPEHRVSRVDSAFDFDGPGTWDRLFGFASAFADGTRVCRADVHGSGKECVCGHFSRPLKVDQQGDWLRGQDGRTFYVGSRKSPAFVRLYEKGRQIRAQQAAAGQPVTASEDWCRVELELRPAKAAKSILASAEALSVWSAATWTRELVLDLLDLDLDPLVASRYRVADDDRALVYMLRQYGPMLRRMASRFGDDWASLGLTLGALLNPESELS